MTRRRLGMIAAGCLVATSSAVSPAAAAQRLSEIQGDGDLGWSVAGIGDVDDDDVPDFAAGAPKTGPGFGDGEVRVFSGADGMPVAALDGMLHPPQGGAFLGRSVAA